MHIDRRPMTFSANGQARVAEDNLVLVFLDDEKVALNATLQIDQHVGDLLA